MILSGLFAWLWPEDRVSPRTLLRLQTQADAAELLPAICPGEWPKPARPPAGPQHRAYEDPWGAR